MKAAATAPTVTEALLRRERWLIGAGLFLLCTLSWWFLVEGAGTGMSTMAMTTWQFPPPAMASSATPWPVSWWLIMIAMWWVMMIAMMIPSAAPTIFLYARVYRQGQNRNQLPAGPAPLAAFLSGYLLAWLAFSLAATGLQWLLEQVGLVHGMMMWSTNRELSAGFLLAAGIYQLSPLKSVCLKHCRSPASWIAEYWRSTHTGVLRMGLEHGLYCVGCCWFLMLLLFVGGIMNLVWIAGLAILVLLEKLAPGGFWIARVSGVACLLAALLLIMR